MHNTYGVYAYMSKIFFPLNVFIRFFNKHTTAAAAATVPSKFHTL